VRSASTRRRIGLGWSDVCPEGGVHVGGDLHRDRGAGSSGDRRGLSRLLADTCKRYLKTHNSHCNVTGQMFSSLHLMFETQYTELALAGK
jgi:hypothetical protein